MIWRFVESRGYDDGFQTCGGRRAPAVTEVALNPELKALSLITKRPIYLPYTL